MNVRLFFVWNSCIKKTFSGKTDYSPDPLRIYCCIVLIASLGYLIKKLSQGLKTASLIEYWFLVVRVLRYDTTTGLKLP